MTGVIEEGFSAAGAGVLMGSVFLRKNEPITDLRGVVVAVATGVAAAVAVPVSFVLRTRDLGKGDAVAPAIDAAVGCAAALRERRGEAEVLAAGCGDAAACAAAFLEVRRFEGEGEATWVVELAEVVWVEVGAVFFDSAFLWTRCFAGEGEATGAALAAGVCPSSNEAPVNMVKAKTRINLEYVTRITILSN